jgi:DNA-binding NarL/FixJ family response regulator
MSERPPVRVLLVDDQELVRSGLRRILRRRAGFEVVAECDDGDGVPAAVAAHAPDLVVMDLRMRRVDGIAATAALRAAGDAPPVLVLTTFDDDELLSGALRAGAAGFCLKDTPADDLVRAAHAVAAGASWLDPTVTGRVLATYRAVSPGPPASCRECEVGLEAALLGVLVQPDDLGGGHRRGQERAWDGRLDLAGLLGAAGDLLRRQGAAGEPERVAEVGCGRLERFADRAGAAQRDREPVQALADAEGLEGVEGGLALGGPIGVGLEVDAVDHPLDDRDGIGLGADPQEQRLAGQGADERLVEGAGLELVPCGAVAVGQGGQAPHRPDLAGAGPHEVSRHRADG